MRQKTTSIGNLPELLTLQQTCKVLNCHPNTLRNWDNKGFLKAVRFGARGDRRYKKLDILPFIGKTIFLKHPKRDLIPLDSVYNELSRNLEILNDSEYSKLVNFSTNQEAPLHNWFKYREGFSASLIKAFLNKDEQGVLDPFCGSGTTLVSAKQAGIPSWGFEINPLSAFVSKVKLENYPKTFIKTAKSVLTSLLKVTNVQYKKPQLKILDQAFNQKILETLLKIKHRIDRILDKKLKSFFTLAWIIILEKASNTYKEGNGIKYRTTRRTANGYVKIDKKEWEDEKFGKNKISYVLELFREQSTEMLNELENIEIPRVPATVYEEDAKKLNTILKPASVSLTIFSPPYANCFDYFETYKLELWLGGFVKSYEELRKLRRKAMRSNLNADLFAPQDSISALETIIAHMDEDALWDSRIPQVLRGYFSDMRVVLDNIFKVSTNNGRCVIVVGNSAYGNVLVPTDLILAQIGKKSGFKQTKIIVARHLTTSSQQKIKLQPYRHLLRESLVVLQK